MLVTSRNYSQVLLVVVVVLPVLLVTFPCGGNVTSNYRLLPRVLLL